MNLSTAAKAASHALIAVLATAALAACGDDSGDDNAAGPASSSGASAGGDATTDASSSPGDPGDASDAADGADGADGGDGDSAPPAAAGDFCTELESLVNTSTNFFEVTLAEFSGKPAPSADDIRTAAEPLPERIVQASLQAPDDLADDLEVMGEYLLSVTGAIEAANYDVSVGTIPQPSAEVNAAEDALNQYARAECGFDPDA